MTVHTIPEFLRRAGSGSRRRAVHQGAVLPVVRLWLLRILVPLDTYRGFISQGGFNNDTLADVLGLGDCLEDATEDFNFRNARARLKEIHRGMEAKSGKVRVPRELRENVERLRALVGLSDADCRVLEFAVMIHSERLLDDVADWLGQLSSVKVFNALSVILGLPVATVRASLAADGILARSGLVNVDRSGTSTLRGKLTLLSDTFADHILSSESDPITLLRDTVSLAPPAQLDLAAYSHVEPTIDIIRPYLRHALAGGRRGVNIFIHGEPGTGKSQLARVLAQDLGSPLFEVASEDNDGDPVSGERRLRAFRAAQSFLAQRRALIVFDEVEDVFNDGDRMIGRRSTAQSRKAWINRMLEENAAPTFWLSNSADCLDPAFIRRFDVVLHLTVPPRRRREALVQDLCGDMLDATVAARIAREDALTPAVVARAASVVRAIRHDIPEGQASQAFVRLVSGTMEAQRHGKLRLDDRPPLPATYDPAFIRCDTNLEEVAGGIAGTRTARICLYGPPGTGKTAFGGWLAERLEMPLRVVRASDLLSKYVGGTEQNIARAFDGARADGALLLIDEVDSFLQDRRGAQRSWEISGVNEMLTQMESFEGVFVASTNLMQDLDQATLRRFDLKLEFGFLAPEQAERLFLRQCSALGLPAPPAAVLSRLGELRTLTPGDFATVGRRHRIAPLRDAAALLASLIAECAVKDAAVRPAMGFV